MVGDRNRYLAAGFNDYIAKPISQRSLHDVIAAVTGLPRQWINRADRPKSSTAVFDKNRIAELRAFLEDGKFHTLMSNLPREIAKHVTRLQAAIADQNPDECRAALHGLKGVAMNFAAERLAATARRLEQDGVSIEAAQIEMPQLLLAISETEAALQAILAATKPPSAGTRESAVAAIDPH
jgi:HPt (histidine-containing phosphotransfer) domain-containing protein